MSELRRGIRDAANQAEDGMAPRTIAGEAPGFTQATSCRLCACGYQGVRAQAAGHSTTRTLVPHVERFQELDGHTLQLDVGNIPVARLRRLVRTDGESSGEAICNYSERRDLLSRDAERPNKEVLHSHSIVAGGFPLMS
jgi:hypothetical protein